MTSAPDILHQIVSGLDGVTAGPWELREYKGRSYVVGPSEIVDGGDVICEVIYSDRTFAEDNANMRHFHRCSPDTILSIAEYVRALTAERDSLAEKLGKAEEALEPFSTFAGELFSRNFNASDSVDTIMTNAGGFVSIYGKDFFAARATLSQIRSEK